MTYAVISFLIGVVLGSRWRVLVLVPVSALVVVAAVWSGLSSDESLVWSVLVAFGCVASLQMGYLFAAAVRVALFQEPAPSVEPEASAMARTPGLRTEP